ncbi:hypothetical protein GGH95_000532, partial [Coemansia sp. RSA 1836]
MTHKTAKQAFVKPDVPQVWPFVDPSLTVVTIVDKTKPYNVLRFGYTMGYGQTIANLAQELCELDDYA